MEYIKSVLFVLSLSFIFILATAIKIVVTILVAFWDMFNAIFSLVSSIAVAILLIPLVVIPFAAFLHEDHFLIKTTYRLLEFLDSTTDGIKI